MDEPDADRPTTLLPLGQLVRLSVYWLGLVAVVQGIGIALQERITVLVPDTSIQYTTLGALQVAGIVIAVLVQPTVGTLSDYTVSRFGRRKPYIVAGTLLDFVFLAGLATSNTVLAVAAFVTLLQLSSNVAQGPFQGYVPDLVAAPQVGLASGMVGLFTVLGVVTGTALATIGVATGDFVLPMIALGVVHLATMVILVFRLNEGRAAKDRGGRSWPSIARGAWGADILRERSFLYLVASRFFILGGSAFLIVLQVPYLERALGMTDRDQRALWILGTTVVAVACTAVATIPAARLSQRVGRKTVIYVAAAISALGMTIAALAPTPPILAIGAILVGIGGGSFLAVDWALLTDIIPKASAGRYMGISNIATATNAVAAAFVGGLVIDAASRFGTPELGPRIAFLIAPVWLAIGALLLRPVDERRREGDGPAGRRRRWRRSPPEVACGRTGRGRRSRSALGTGATPPAPPSAAWAPRSSKRDPRTDDEVLDRGRHQDVARSCEGRDPCTDVDGDPPDIGIGQLDLARVQAGAHLQADGADGLADSRGASDRSGRSIEDGQEPVAGRLDLAAAVSVQLGPYGEVMRRKERSPTLVAELGSTAGGVDDVREEHGREDAIRVLPWSNTSHELLDVGEQALLVACPRQVLVSRQLDVAGARDVLGEVAASARSGRARTHRGR